MASRPPPVLLYTSAIPIIFRSKSYHTYLGAEDEDEFQSPMRPTRGAAAGLAQEDGKGSVGPPLRECPPPGLLPPPDMCVVF